MIIARSLFAVTCALAMSVGVHAQVAPSERAITLLRGNVYLARVDWRATVFFVTQDGIIVGDPISAEGARWLRGELATRFPGQRVRYVLQSHHHFDRAAGASVFEGAETIGHRLFNLEVEKKAKGSAVYGDIAPVKRTFDVRERLTVGGRNVEIVHTGPAHSPDMSALYFPEEHLLFDVEPPRIDMVPFVFGTYTSPQDVARWLAVVSMLDIDTIVTSDGRSIDASAVRVLKPYLDDLIAAVTAGVRDGRSLPQLRSEIVLPAHTANGHYAGRAAHIERVYRGLSLRQWNIQIAAGLGRMNAPSTYCAGYDPCDPPGGVVPSGTLGLGHSFGRTGFVAEIDFGDQLFASRSSRFYDDIVSNRRTRASGLMSYRLGSKTGTGVDVLGGATWISSDTRGLDRIKETLPPLGGRHDVVAHEKMAGYTVGAELVLSVTRRWSLRTPVRFTMSQDEELHPGRQDFRVGVGLAYRMGRRVAIEPGQPEPVVMRTTP